MTDNIIPYDSIVPQYIDNIHIMSNIKGLKFER